MVEKNRLLLPVEDDPVILAHNKQQLEAAGHIVHTETTAEGARFSDKDNNWFYEEMERRGVIPTYYLLT